MSVLSESAKLLTHYDMVWGKKHGIAKKDIKKSLNLIWGISTKTNCSVDEAETVFVSFYKRGI